MNKKSKNEEEFTTESVKRIEKARESIKRGKYLTAKEAKRKLKTR
jgi:hypothetical protein